MHQKDGSILMKEFVKILNDFFASKNYYTFKIFFLLLFLVVSLLLTKDGEVKFIYEGF